MILVINRSPLTHFHAEFILGIMKKYLHLFPFLKTEMAQVIENLY